MAIVFSAPTRATARAALGFPMQCANRAELKVVPTGIARMALPYK